MTEYKSPYTYFICPKGDKFLVKYILTKHLGSFFERFRWYYVLTCYIDCWTRLFTTEKEAEGWIDSHIELEIKALQNKKDKPCRTYLGNKCQNI